MPKKNVKRVSSQEARKRVASGEALLVCAYDSDDNFSRMHLDGALSLSDFKSRLPELRIEQGLIFYCA